jgi:ribonuclease HII
VTLTAPRRHATPLPRLLRHDCRLPSTPRLVGGADEAGRGALAGPLVAAGVLLEPRTLSRAQRRALARLDDSKRLTAAVRDALFPVVVETALRISVVIVSVVDVDRHGVHHANLHALAGALRRLDAPCDAALLADGFRLPLERDHTAVIDGDAKSASIAAASIIAKVTRDRLMHELAAQYPGYGFDHNAGYGTPEHLLALRRLGATGTHRRSFAPCAQLSLQTGDEHPTVR